MIKEIGPSKPLRRFLVKKSLEKRFEWRRDIIRKLNRFIDDHLD
jgi:hypothetical protein